MTKIITVIGATGTQGGSVIRALLNQPSYTIRAITRNPDSTAAKDLTAQGIQVVKADLHDAQSLITAFTGTHVIFAVTNFFEHLPSHGLEEAMAIETKLGINLAQAAAATDSLEHYIWSTLPNSRVNSNGSVVVPYYESKNRVDEFIRSVPALLAKTTFAWFGWYAGNVLAPLFHPTRIHTADGSESYITMVNVPPSTKLPVVGDEKVNIGLFVKAIVEQPEKTHGKIVRGVMEVRTFEEVASAFAVAKGIQFRCVQIRREDSRALWGALGEALDESLYYLEVTGERCFAAPGQEVLGPEDLGVGGLVGFEEAYASLPLLG
ncbi:NAD(P)-binding protein [Aspergillus californicus]